MERVTLHEEYRLIERTEAEVNGAWKGAHLLLFFLAFVFGSFCTFCFHLLMYLFEEKCVLFPKLLSITSLRQNIIYELMPEDRNSDMLPVDFLSTQWVEKSACLLPTYVPLVSGIFGLVWTTMFLMCSTGSRILTGLQRPWRVLPPVFLFSLAMGCLCVYTSVVTHYGLKELCLKLSEITGSTTCTYTVNVATLPYERRIRGVYQATRLTIYSAWLHTSCWLLSALLALTRVILAIDFKLVRVTVQLKGNIDRMLEQHERQIGTIEPDEFDSKYPSPIQFSNSAVRIHFKKQNFLANYDSNKDLIGNKTRNEDAEEGELLYYSNLTAEKSEQSLLPSEKSKLVQLKAISDVPDTQQFILKILYKILDAIDFRSATRTPSENLIEINILSQSMVPVTRQYGKQRIESNLTRDYHKPSREQTADDQFEAQEIVKEINKLILDRLHENINQKELLPSKSNLRAIKSSLNIHSDFKLSSDEKLEPKSFEDKEGPEQSYSKDPKVPRLKSNLKRVGVQTIDATKEKPTVHIHSETNILSSNSSQSIQVNKKDKVTQTKKDKQE